MRPTRSAGGRPKPRWLFHEPSQVHSQGDHPLVRGDAQSVHPEVEALRLIHLKAYVNAASQSRDQAVLDIGCNDGYGTVLLGRQARRVVGVDVAPRAISVARARPDARRIEFMLVDGTALPFADATFDLVTAFQVIEHIEDVRSFLDEIRRVTRPGGTVVFTTPNAAIRLDPGMRPWNPFHIREYTARELAAELEGVFASVQVRGLFAPPAITQVELARVGAARERARHPRPWPMRVFVAVLPGPAKTMIRRFVSSGRVANTIAAHAYTVDDLWFEVANLDNALDLHATCVVASSARVLPEPAAPSTKPG